MNTEFRYNLERNSKKNYCCNCNKKTFVRYIDAQNGNYLPAKYGRCDRESNCGYHLNPYNDGFSKIIKDEKGSEIIINKNRKQKIERRKLVLKRKHEYIPVAILNSTLDIEGYEQNTFIQNLLNHVPFPIDANDLENVISQYYLGTIRHGYRAGATTFPFIDTSNKVHAVQVKKFDMYNHTIGTDFLHSILEKQYRKKKELFPEWLQSYQNNDKKVSCLFGEHLLKRHLLNPVALVEAPKTAIYGTLYFGFPDNPRNLLWLAVYNLSSLNFEKCKVLRNRDVFLFPDLSKNGYAFRLWSTKATEFSVRLEGTKFKVSDWLENNANQTEREEGLDLADYLIKRDWRIFRNDIPAKKKQHSDSLYLKSEKGEKGATIKKSLILSSLEISHSSNEEKFKNVYDKSNYPSLNLNSKENSKTNEEINNIVKRHQSIGEFFDLLYGRGHKKLPENFKGANTVDWKTQIN